MGHLGGCLLEELLSTDSGHRGNRFDCGEGHQASFVGYRAKNLDAVLGPVRLTRAWYHCTQCGGGLAPKDAELGVAGASLSPGLRAMGARVGSQEPFAQARRDLSELAGIRLSTKRVERSAEADGDLVRAATKAQAELATAGFVVPLRPTEAVDKLYGQWTEPGCQPSPPKPKGRAGKSPDGRARTREVKLGCVFTRPGLTNRPAQSAIRVRPAT